MTHDAAPPLLADLASQPGRVPLHPDAVAAALAAALTSDPAFTGWRVLPGSALLGSASRSSASPAAASPASDPTPPQLAVTYATGDFATALALANRIGAAAEATDHHPDLTVSYGRLHVTMHSHDVGALTSRDVRLARTVADLAGEVLRPHALAVYGTLAPGRSNAHIMDGMAGTWTPATVRGVLHETGIGAATGYPGIVLESTVVAGPSSAPSSSAPTQTSGVDIPAQLFLAADLPDHWARLDAFEGAGYRRVPAVATLAGEGPAVRPVWIYELAPDAVPLSQPPARAESEGSAQ